MITHSCLVCDLCVLYRMVFIPVFISLLFVLLIQMYCNLHLFHLNFNLQCFKFIRILQGTEIILVDRRSNSTCSINEVFLST